MKIQSHLDELRDKVSGCDLTAFGDLSSGVILRSSSPAPVTRDKLDQLCQAAKQCFELSECIGHSDEPQAEASVQSVMSFSAQDSKIFARDAREPNDVTCTVIKAGHGLEAALENTVAIAAEIGSDGV